MKKGIDKNENSGIQINKFISNTGFCSRREAEKLIEQARVTINDELCLLSARVHIGDIVEVDGEPLLKKTKPIYIVLNKPTGITSTTDSPLTADAIMGMSKGVKMLGTITKPCIIKQEGPKRFRIILTQGLNRQIRRMCAIYGYTVKSLKRIRIMHLHLDNLKTGAWRYLTPQEISTLEKQLTDSKK